MRTPELKRRGRYLPAQYLRYAMVKASFTGNYFPDPARLRPKPWVPQIPDPDATPTPDVP